MKDDFVFLDEEEGHAPAVLPAPVQEPLQLDALLAKAGKRRWPYKVIWATYQRELYPVLVSPEHYELCQRSRWFLSKSAGGSFYARTTLPKKERGSGMPTKLSMHRLLGGLAKAPPCIEIDHGNGVSLDNRKPNLKRVLTILNNSNRSISGTNKHGFIGVYKIPGFKVKGGEVRERSKPFRALLSIGIAYRRHVGSFETAEEAARERDFELRKLAQDHIPLVELNKILNFPLKRKNRLKRMGKAPKRLNGAAKTQRMLRVLYNERKGLKNIHDNIPF